MSLLGKIKSCQPVPECFLEILPVCEIPESGRLPASSLLSWRARRAWVGMEGLGGGGMEECSVSLSTPSPQLRTSPGL